MLQFLRYLLFPISIIYYLITSIRNFLFDVNLLKSKHYPIKTIVVGNLSVGGTGKTPMTELLINLLSKKFKTAILSRGYLRKSKGFVLANIKSKVQDLGDEPFQFYSRFTNISVAVDANRQNGIEKLTELINPEIILLDDAFQHRKVKAGFYILLTQFNQLYINDFVLPTGNLRESSKGAKRANIIVITKCPKDLSIKNQEKMIKNINPKPYQKVFFSTIVYDDFIYNKKEKIAVESIKKSSKLLLAGIAFPKPFFEYLNSENTQTLEFNDHHDFTEKDIENILKLAQDKIIITTEKDYMRLQNKIDTEKLFFLPIKTKIINNENIFNQLIYDYVRTN